MKKSEWKKFEKEIISNLEKGEKKIFLRVQLLNYKVKIIYGIYHGIGGTNGINDLIIRTGLGRDAVHISIKHIASVNIADPVMLVQNLNTLKEITDRMY